MRMTPKATLILILILALAVAGCGDQSAAVTDPSKLPALTEEQKNAVKAADQQVAAEENANPTRPQKGKGGSR